MAALPALILFARAPEPGRVKTRLARRLTERGAAELYRAFLEDASRVYLSVDRWRSRLCADPSPAHPLLSGMFPEPWTGEPQGPGGLDERLTRAFERERRAGAPAAVAVGSDHPALSRRRVAEVFESLSDGLDAAVVPAEDGGYCAIGLGSTVPLPVVFRDIAWSTDAVLRQTVARLVEVGARYRLLEPAYDVDRPEDLDRLRRDLSERDAAAEDFPAATARALAALDGRSSPGAPA